MDPKELVTDWYLEDNKGNRYKTWRASADAFHADPTLTFTESFETTDHAMLWLELQNAVARITELEALLYAATKHDAPCLHQRCHPNECIIAEARTRGPRAWTPEEDD